ncbi:MAG: hypothetical protein EOM20_12955 [Spartobacteria bacterium]|nr:hypothetical protein [Spartobacteria bacterium]
MPDTPSEPGRVSAPEDSRLLSHVMFLAVVMGIANIANILFQIAMGRMLTREDYGVLMAMYGMLYILNVPGDILRTTLAHYSATHGAADVDTAVIAHMFKRVMRFIIQAMTPVVIGIILANALIVRYFQLEGSGPVYAVVGVCVASIVMTAFQGVLQGLQQFMWYGISVIFWFFGRLFFAVFLVWMGFRATGALVGMMLGAVIALFLPYFCLRKTIFMKSDVESGGFRTISSYAARVLVVYGAFMFIGNVDVMAAKHHFSPEMAGAFSQGALLAHMIWLLPFPIVLAMFPKVVQAHVRGQNPVPLLLKSLLMSVCIIFLVAFFVCWQSDLLFSVFFAQDHHPIQPFMTRFVMAMAPVSILFVLINYEMALERFKVSILMVLASLYLATLLFGVVENYAALLDKLMVTNWLLMVLTALMCLWHSRRASLEEK